MERITSALFNNHEHTFGTVTSTWLLANKHKTISLYNVNISFDTLFISHGIDGSWNFHYIGDKIFAFRKTPQQYYQFVMLHIWHNQYVYNERETMYIILHITKQTPDFQYKSLHGEWSLLNTHGTYKYDPVTSICTTSTNTTGASLVFTQCGPIAPNYDVCCNKVRITLLEGNVVNEIHDNTPGKRIYVLPSQLNCAEYPNNQQIVQKIQEYLCDQSGGPSAQLATDPGIAQFIIDNASNEIDRNGFNNMKFVLDADIKGIVLRNGYLSISSTITQEDVDIFTNRLHLITLTGIENILACGLTQQRKEFASHHGVCDLLYASAVPYGTYGNPASKRCETVAKLTLFAQFVCALKYAIQRKPCKLYFMPLGGGFFQNPYTWICDALKRAIHTMNPGLFDVSIFILCWNGNGEIVNYRKEFS
jgi:hypothetical protein